jgi:hypothetical protein
METFLQGNKTDKNLKDKVKELDVSKSHCCTGYQNIYRIWQQEGISQMCVSHVLTAVFTEKSCTWVRKLVMGI